MSAIFDELDGFWTVIDDDGDELCSPFDSEQDAWDWIDMQEDA